MDKNTKTSLWFLAACLLVTAWSNILFALFILPLIYFVAKGKRTAMVIAMVYIPITTLISVAGYIEKSRNEAGDFVSSLTPVYAFVILGGFTLRYLYLAHKAGKLKTS
jgi:hypothetical protein